MRSLSSCIYDLAERQTLYGVKAYLAELEVDRANMDSMSLVEIGALFDPAETVTLVNKGENIATLIYQIEASPQNEKIRLSKMLEDPGRAPLHWKLEPV